MRPNKSEWALICPKKWNQRILLLISENHNSNITTFKVRFFPSDNCNQFWHVCLMQSPLFNLFTHLDREKYAAKKRQVIIKGRQSLLWPDPTDAYHLIWMDADFWPLPWREIVSCEVQHNCWGTFPLHVSVIYHFNHSNINTTTQHIWATLVTKINALTQISRNNRLWKASGTFRTQSDLSMSMAINCWLNIMRKFVHFSFKLMEIWLL